MVVVVGLEPHEVWRPPWRVSPWSSSWHHPVGGGSRGKPEGETPLEGGQPAPGGRGVPPPQLASGAADEDVVRARIDHPVVSFSRIVVVSWDLDEALVKAKRG